MKRLLLLVCILSGLLLCSCSSEKRIAAAVSDPEKTINIDLTHCRLTEFPKEILQCKNLENLKLYGNRIDSIPPEIGTLKNLKYLTLSKNRLRYIPKEIGELNELKEFYARGNYLTSLPAEIGKLDSLIILDVQYNQIVSLPPEIGDMQSLRELYLGYNSILYIPKEIGKLQKLQYLIIGRNALEPNGLPNEVADLGMLRTLDVAGSGRLLRLPDNIAYINTLDYVYVDPTIILPYALTNNRHRPQIIVKSF